VEATEQDQKLGREEGYPQITLHHRQEGGHGRGDQGQGAP